MSDAKTTLFRTRFMQMLQERKSADPEKSYVSSLYARGASKIAQKVGEEALEAAIEAVRLDEKPSSSKRKDKLKDELADLFFHTHILMAHFNIDAQEIWDILEAREGLSGHTEKAARKTKNNNSKK